MLVRTLTLRAEAEAIREEERIITLSFASEEPVMRWFSSGRMPEILRCDEGDADLSRLSEIGVLLYNHNRDKVIGKVLRVWMENGRGMADVQFDDDPESLIIWNKVRSGTLKGVSFAYTVIAYEEVGPGKKDTSGRFTGPCMVATRWQPYEISIVSIPADATVGVGRAFEERNGTNMGENENTMTPGVATTQPEQTAPAAPATREIPESEVNRVLEEERQRVRDITALCRSFNIDPAQWINDGSNMDAVRAAVLEQLRQTAAPATAPVRHDITMVAEAADRFRDAAVDALSMRAGLTVEKPADGAQDLRGMSLKNIAIECLSQQGQSVSKLMRMSDTDLFGEVRREFANPTALFPAILDAAINKAIVEKYTYAGTTFERWTAKGTLHDFKMSPDHEYLMSEAEPFERVPENGEIKAGMVQTELLPQRKLDTYARSFSMTRQAFINDDIGFLSAIPGKYAAAAKRTINKQCYEMLFNNAVIFDSKNFFCADHNNLLAAGTGMTAEAIKKMRTSLRQQKDHFGSSIISTPNFLILPVSEEYDYAAQQIFLSQTINTTDNTQAYNPLYGMQFDVISDNMLNTLAGEKAAPWFMGDKGIPCIKVDYLNGIETPTVQRVDFGDTLAYKWNFFLDWGITVIDFRGMVRNPGIKL